MTIVVNHSTPADGSFSSTGAAAWNANHTLSGVGTLAEQNANAVAITGGAINGTTVGVTTPASGAFTTLSATTPLSISSGGTAATTSNGAFNRLSGYTTNTTASIALSTTSTYNQFFIGGSSSATLPEVITLTLGYTFHIVNQTSAVSAVYAFDGTTIAFIPINTGMLFTCINTTGADATAWIYATSDLWSTGDGASSGNTGITGIGKVVLQIAPSITGPAISNATSISLQSAGAEGGLTLVRNTGTTTNSTRMYLDSSTASGVTAIYNSGGSILFNTNAALGSSAGANQFRVVNTTSAVNYVQVTGSTTTAGLGVATISGAGTATNVDVALTPQAAGRVRFGTYTGTILTPTGYIDIKDSGGTARRLLVG